MPNDWENVREDSKRIKLLYQRIAAWKIIAELAKRVRAEASLTANDDSSYELFNLLREAVLQLEQIEAKIDG